MPAPKDPKRLEELRRSQAERGKARWADPEFRARMDKTRRTPRNGTPEYEAWKNSPEYEKIRLSSKTTSQERWNNPEYKHRMLTRRPRKGDPGYEEWLQSPEGIKVSQGNSSATKKKWEDPVYRQKQSDARTGHKTSQETRQNISVALKKRQAALSPEERQAESIHRLDAAGDRPWTPEEDAILLEKRLSLTARQLTELLPGRTVAAIKIRSRSLDIVKAAPLDPIQFDGLPASLFLPREGEKACIQCGLIKPHGQFLRAQSNRFGLRPRCRACEKQAPRSPLIANHGTESSKQENQDKEDQLIISEGMKKCTRCKQIKPLDKFFVRGDAKVGRQSVCKDCKRPTKAQGRQFNLRHIYGMTIEEYNAMLEEQNGVCAICGKPETATRDGQALPLHVDHCHTTDAIRGLLCAKCNTALGLMHEDPDRIKALLKYIEERCLW